MRRAIDVFVVVLFAAMVLMLFAAVRSDASAEETPALEAKDVPKPFHVDVPTLRFDVDFSEPVGEAKPEEWTEPEYVEPYVE